MIISSLPMYTYAPNITDGSMYNCPHVCEHYKNVTLQVILDQAPCPPVWKTSLFWNHPKYSTLSTYEVNYIVDRCKIRTEKPTDSAKLWLVILVSILGVIAIVSLFILIWFKKKRKEKVDNRSESPSSGGSIEVNSSTARLTFLANDDKPAVHFNNNAHDNEAFDKSNDNVEKNERHDSKRQTLLSDKTDSSEKDEHGEMGKDDTSNITGNDHRPENKEKLGDDTIHRSNLTGIDHTSENEETLTQPYIIQ